MSEDECEEYFTIEKRTEALGFKPQKEILINTLLPYADQMDEESTKLFAQIKSNLGKAVMLRELKPGCGVWSAKLIKYLRIYGMKFSKEDHIALIKLVYELIMIPDLEPVKVHKFSTLFVMLTSKKALISPQELVLPWRPLYDLAKRLFIQSTTKIGLYYNFRSVETSYVALVKCAKPYFELNATKEILEELLSQFSPWSNDSHIVNHLVAFLPVDLHPEHADVGHELWLTKLLDIWDTCYNGHCIVGDLLPLFAYLAKRNPGTVDWTPQVPAMFARFLRAFNLPVSYKDTHLGKNYGLEIKHIAMWIVWTISPDGVTLKHLRSFLCAVESYLHSANSGRWSFKLKDLLRKLAREFLNRVRRETRKAFQKSWENQIPKGYKLREQDITEFVQILVEPTLSAVFSRNGVGEVALTLQNLATLRPAIVIPPLLEKFRSSLESLTEPHRVTAAMQAASAVARPMLQGAKLGYPEGPTHVVPLLMSSLPGLDPNDIKKTLVTLHFILVFSWMVPFIDCSSAYEYWPDLTEEELLTCESTAQFEDFILLYLERIFIIIESNKMENVRHETTESDSIRSKMESITENSLFSSTTAVLIQCSPKILNEAMRKFKTFALNSTFETNVSGNMVGVILKVFARVNPDATLAAFVPQLCEEILELLETDESLEEDNPPRELLYRLLLLSHAVECDGQSLPPYMPRILTVLDRALIIRNKEAYIMASEILKHMMTSFSTVELMEFRSCSKDYSKAPEEWLPIREWGRACSLKDANLKWHVPNKKERDCAQELFDRYAKPEIETLKLWLAGDDTIDHKRRLRSFHILHASLACNNFLPAPEEDAIKLVESLVPATSFPLTSGIDHFITLDGKNIRLEIIQLLNLVQEKMLKVKSDDTKGFEKLIQLWDRVGGVRSNRSGIHLEARMRSYAALERALDGKGGPLGGGRIRTLLADAARLQDEARADLQSDAGIGNVGLIILNALYELSINTYTSVRRLAQMRLNSFLSHYAYSYRILLPKLTSLLEIGGEGDEWHAKHKGALYIMLGSRMGPLVAKQDWDLIKTLWPAILKSPLSEKPSILRLEQSFHELLRHYFPTTNTKTKMSPGCIVAASVLLNEAEKSDPNFMDCFNTAGARELAICDRNETLYYNLVNELVKIAETPSVHRRRLELTMHLLTFCPIKESPYPPNAIRLILNSLIHDNITVRRIATTLMVFVLKQRKRKAKKIKIDPYEIAGIPRPKEHAPGYRKDLEWAMWSDAGVPNTDEEWDKPWLKTSDYGFYTWPQELMVSAPTSDQPPINRKPEEMEEGEKCIYEFFMDEEKMNQLINYLTVEEKKGKDKFSAIRFFMFKYLFSSFGETITMKFLERALTYAGNAQEASQRSAAEIAAAAVRAPRYWPRESAIRVYEESVKVLKIGLTAIIPETVEDWTVCVLVALENQDPRRAAIVFEAVMELCLPASDADADQESSFGVCARIHAFRGILNTLSWRGAPLASALLRRLCAANFIQHPYHNVRDSIGGLLMYIFNTELVFTGGQAGPAPRLADFIAEIKPKLAPLYDSNGEIIINVGAGAGESSCSASHGTPPAIPEPDLATGEALVSMAVASLSTLQSLNEEQAQQGDDSSETSEGDPIVLMECAEKGLPAQLQAGLQLGGEPAASGPRQHARALNLLTTVLRTCAGAVTVCVGGSAGAQYALAGMACALAARGPPQPHDEVGRAADAFLASLALARHSPETFDVALQHIEDIAKTKSWWARLACVSFAQPLLFYGLPFLCAEPARAARAEAFALALMRDPRVEVRQAAAKLLTGLMHCQALPNEEKTIKKLIKFCHSKEIVQRHCGVLGLCGYLASRPYSLGNRIGAVLYELSKHTNAPEPIPSSIRTTLADFRRTHQDDWPKHREALTAEELDLLAELTSPPTYCA